MGVFTSPRGVAIIAATLLMWLVVGTPSAAAHSNLVSSVPAADEQVAMAPTEVVLTFNENIEPTLVTVRITDPDQADVATAPPAVDGGVVRVPLTGAVKPGSYTVAYRVVSADGHPVTGEFGYTLAQPGGAPVPPPDATPAASLPAAPLPAAQLNAPVDTANDSHTQSSNTIPIVIVAAVVAALSGAVLLVKRRSAKE